MSGYRDDWNYRPKPPRPTAGIRAQSQRGAFGKSWWAGRWIAALERLVDGGRLARGRSYARSGQVVTLEVGPGGVAARVQGSRPQPYKVSIRFRALTDAEWAKVIAAMADQAIYAAKLLNGEMPEQIEEVFRGAGASLLPAQAGDLLTECSCPDYANPCKHVAAVHYLLGERFATDPFLIFLLRGRSQAQIAAALRATRAESASVPATEEAAPPAPVEAEVFPPLAVSLAAFWGTPAAAPAVALTFTAPARDALAVKQLGAPGFWPAPGMFTPLLEQLYRDTSTYALGLALGETENVDPT